MKKYIFGVLIALCVSLLSGPSLHAFSITPEHIDELKTAAQKGIVVAQVLLGLLYEGGEVLPQDYHKAQEWYEKAAAQGDAQAQYNLGLLYYHGRGVQQDYAQANVYFKKACADGLQEGCDASKKLNTEK